jgi:hypothetical protein
MTTPNSSMHILIYAAVKQLTRLLGKTYRSCWAQPTEAVGHRVQELAQLTGAVGNSFQKLLVTVPKKEPLGRDNRSL